jgi:rod shape-determining protein MreD
MTGLLVIALTFVVAMVLAILPLPDSVPIELGYLRPQWVVLVLIYWVIALPDRGGILAAWSIGLIVDVLLGSLLGQHGVAFILVAYIASSLYQRLRMFSLWQQSMIVFAIVGLNQLINFWIESIVGIGEWNLWYLLSSVVSALLWPSVFLLLRYCRRQFNVI